MSEDDLRKKKAMLCLDAKEAEDLFRILENDYEKMTADIEALVGLLKARRADISIGTYETMFAPEDTFRKTIEDYQKAEIEHFRLKSLVENF